MAAVVLFLVLCFSVPCESALMIPTQGGGADGMIARDWYSNPNNYWVDSGSATVNAYHDGGNRWWYRGLIIINISSLAGKTIESTTFNFYSNGFSGVNLQYVGGIGPVLTTAYGQIAGSNIASLDGSTGWKSYDVSSYVQSGINNNYQNIGFVFNAVVNYGSGTAGSAEGGQAAYLNVIVPEPATMCLLGIGGMCLLRRKK